MSAPRVRAAAERMMLDPAEFRRHVLVDVSGKPQRFESVTTAWQRRDFEATSAGWQRAVGLSVPDPQFNRAFLLRGRGGSKTCDIAVIAAWALWAAPKAISGIAASGAKDQAALIVKAIRTLLQLNPWLKSVLDVQRFAVVNKRTGSELNVIAADAGLAYGHLVDFILADELCHWGPGGEELWHVLFSTAGKRANCVLQVLSNAGTIDSWQHKLCESMRQSPDCYYSQTDETETLLSPKQLAEQRRVLPPTVFDRLFRNIWVPDTGDALDAEALQRCVCDYQYPMRNDDHNARGWAFIAGADLSATTDASAVTVLAVNAMLGKIRVAFSKRFAPKNGEIDLPAVVDTIKSLHQQYRLLSLHLDPYESRRLAIELRRNIGLRVVIESFSGNNAAVQASALLSAINSNQIDIHESETGLLQDLRSLSIVERAGVLRVVADRNARGHADQAFSLIACLPAAQELLNRRVSFDADCSVAIGRRARTNGHAGVWVSDYRHRSRN